MPETRWALGVSSPKKRIHRSDCRYARRPYTWAGDRSPEELLDALIEVGAVAWHDAGICCCANLDTAIRRAACGDDLTVVRSKLSEDA